jgi:hypothetical protein
MENTSKRLLKGKGPKIALSKKIDIIVEEKQMILGDSRNAGNKVS